MKGNKLIEIFNNKTDEIICKITDDAMLNEINWFQS